ncbi:Lar family restriction alleviation protein [Anaerolineales bacterium HSG6]|nr:Lar family restriction alleviation protein [Anaerolineales bacterium HSG6]
MAKLDSVSDFMKITVQLMPCPYCGSSGNDLEVTSIPPNIKIDIYLRDIVDGIAEDDNTKLRAMAEQIVCTNCYARGPESVNLDEAVEKWNRRAKEFGKTE